MVSKITLENLQYRIVLLIVAFVTHDLGCTADLVVKPSNVAVVKGRTATVECKTNNSSLKLIWRMSDSNNTEGAIIYTGNKLITESSKFFKIETRGGGVVHLLIEANEMTAKRYTCEEPGAMRASAELIVLAFKPLCTYTYFDSHNANAAAVTSNKGRHTEMQCYLIYWGNWAPEMEWIQVSEGSSRGGESSVSVKEGVYHSSSDNFVSTAITVAGNSCRSDMSYKCVSRFTATKKPLNTTATNIPDNEFTWSTSICYNHTDKSDAGSLATTDKSDAESLATIDCMELTTSLIVVGTVLVLVITVFLVIYLVMKQRKRAQGKRSNDDQTTCASTQVRVPLNEYGGVTTKAAGCLLNSESPDAAAVAQRGSYTYLKGGERIRSTTYTKIQLPELEGENLYSDIDCLQN